VVRIVSQAGERTRDIYERVGGYRDAAPVPLPGPGDIDSLAEVGFAITPTSRAIVKAGLALSGYTAFARTLPGTAENLMRTHDLRGAALFAPVLSATLALADDPRRLGPIERAATLVLAARSLHADIQAGRLDQDRHRGAPLEMGQYSNLFSTCLVIDDEKGRARIFKSTCASKISVIVGGRSFLLDVGEPGEGATYTQLADALGRLVALAAETPRSDEAPGAGRLTGADDSTQRRIFQRLKKIPGNAQALEAIRHSFFTLCLDLDTRPMSYGEAAKQAHSGNHGNRWYHSSLQLVVFGNGMACAINNFSAYLDGNTMVRGMAELQRRAARSELPQNEGCAANPLPVAQDLRWQVDPHLDRLAGADLAAIQDEQTSSFEIEGVGRRFFNAYGLEPIPCFIIALELAAQRLTKERVKITQLLTMSKHRCTDLRTAHVATPEVMRFVEHLEMDTRRSEESRTLLKEAIDSQERQCRRARSSVSLAELVILYLATRRGLRRLGAAAVLVGGMALLRFLRLYRPIPHEVLVSHPEVHPEIPVLGRPGVRLPYLSRFSLHYQIHDEKIVVTVAPSIAWTVPNVELAEALKVSLDDLRRAIVASGQEGIRRSTPPRQTEDKAPRDMLGRESERGNAEDPGDITSGRTLPLVFSSERGH
jgi:hypothetical protein